MSVKSNTFHCIIVDVWNIVIDNRYLECAFCVFVCDFEVLRRCPSCKYGVLVIEQISMSKSMLINIIESIIMCSFLTMVVHIVKRIRHELCIALSFLCVDWLYYRWFLFTWDSELKVNFRSGIGVGYTSSTWFQWGLKPSYVILDLREGIELFVDRIPPSM